MYEIPPGGKWGLQPAGGLENYILHFSVIWGYHVQHLITQKVYKIERNACSFEKVNKKSLI